MSIEVLGARTSPVKCLKYGAHVPPPDVSQLGSGGSLEIKLPFVKIHVPTEAIDFEPTDPLVDLPALFIQDNYLVVVASIWYDGNVALVEGMFDLVMQEQAVVGRVGLVGSALTKDSIGFGCMLWWE